MRLALPLPTTVAALLLGVSAAYMAGAVVAARDALRPPALDAPVAEAVPQSAPPPPLTSILEKNPFGLAVEAAGPPAVEAAPPPPTGRLMLVGVAVAGPRSRALLRDLDAGEADLYRIGDAVGGERLVAVRRDHVLFEPLGGGPRRRLDLGVDPGATAAAPSAPAEGGGGGAPADGARVVSRREILAAVGGRDRVDAILGQTRLLPRFVDGRIRGFRVEDIARDSLIGEMGIETGDVVLRVNGQTLDSHERGFQIWQEAKTAGEIALEVERGGRMETLRYRFTR